MTKSGTEPSSDERAEAEWETEFENGRPVVVVVPGLGGVGGFLPGVDAVVRALKGLLELCAPIPGVVAVDVELGPTENDGEEIANDEDSGG